jgi:ABC-type glycerol-3-phosphate transport system permease component
MAGLYPASPISVALAVIDGASMIQVLWRIMLSITTLGLVTMLVINFINGWNNLLHRCRSLPPKWPRL